MGAFLESLGLSKLVRRTGEREVARRVSERRGGIVFRCHFIAPAIQTSFPRFFFSWRRPRWREAFLVFPLSSLLRSVLFRAHSSSIFARPQSPAAVQQRCAARWAGPCPADCVA